MYVIRSPVAALSIKKESTAGPMGEALYWTFFPDPMSKIWHASRKHYLAYYLAFSRVIFNMGS